MTTTLTRPHQQIIDKAEAEIRVLDKAHHEAQSRFRVLQAEQETIDARRQARAVELTTRFNSCSYLQSQYDTLDAQSQLAVNTLGEGKMAGQLRSAQREANKAAQALDKLQQRHASAEASDVARSAQIDKEGFQ